ncbi:MAG TPA: hypothetical protein VK025_04155 [Steroidobacter sp.]|nr:hypothetical protein [Steroidobacter sp.]
MQRLVNALKLRKIGDVAVRRNPWYYSQARGVLEDLRAADLAARREWTQERLEKVLWFARRTPYGARVRGCTDLASWPLLRKPQVQAAPAAFRAGSHLLSVQASTGGTSGAPLRLSRSLRSIAFEQASIDLMMRELGVEPSTARCAVLRTDAIKDPNDFRPPYWIEASGGRRLIFSSSHLNAATVNSYADALEQFAPDVLLGYPTSLEALCVLLERVGRTLHIPRILSSSEMLSPQVWRAAQRRLGCALLDYYGQAERVAFAFAMQPGEYRFLPGYAHVEFEFVGLEEEQHVYEIVGTSLWNSAMPLVRYCTGDLIRAPRNWGPAELEELALSERTFSGVFGRSGDILLTPDGVCVTGVSHFQRDVPHVMRIQVIQETVREVVILVLADAGYSERDAQRLLQNVRSKLPASMRVEITRAEALERTARGKTPFVIHRPAVRALLEQGRARGSA